MLRLEGIEKLLMSPSKQYSAEKLIDILGNLSPDFDLDRLSAQLSLFPSVNSEIETTQQLLLFFQSLMPETSKKMLDEIGRLINILVVVPATSTTGARSFSALRRIFTYLRTTMTQMRLFHLTLLNIRTNP